MQPSGSPLRGARKSSAQHQRWTTKEVVLEEPPCHTADLFTPPARARGAIEQSAQWISDSTYRETNSCTEEGISVTKNVLPSCQRALVDLNRFNSHSNASTAFALLTARRVKATDVRGNLDSQYSPKEGATSQ
jgi:hypothetical protein